MSRVTITRTTEDLPNEEVLIHVRRFLFGFLEGWNEDDKKGWRKIWKRLMSLSAGEPAEI